MQSRADHANRSAAGRIDDLDPDDLARPKESLKRVQPTDRPPDYLTLENIDRALFIGDGFFFFVTGLLVSYFYLAEGLSVNSAAAVLVATLVFIRIARNNKLYRLRAHQYGPTLARRLLQTLIVTFVLIVTTAFAFRAQDIYSREWVLLWFWGSAISLFAYRGVIALVARAALRSGHLLRRVAIYGGDAQGATVMEHLTASGDVQYALVGFYDDRFQRVPTAIQGFERRGGMAELEHDVERGLVDEVIVALPLSAVERLDYIVNRLSRFSVTVLFAPDLTMWRFFERPVETIGGAPMLRVIDTPIEGWAGVAKFIEDRVLATLLLILASPLFAIIAIAIKLDSPGPLLFKQPRRGWNGSLFTIYKFRTMRNDSLDEKGATQVKRSDPRVTRVGRILRRASLDELPQLVNVFKGDMSLVGPRPHALGTQADGQPFEEAVADYMRRYRVKPGITGWAQVNGWRGETDTNRKLLVRVRYDVFYIENWSFWFDIYILFITPFALIFRSDNAY